MSYLCKSQELPWRNNTAQISCIPPGDYDLRWTRSPRLSADKGVDVYTWEIMNVPGRGGIRIHAGNYAGVKLADSKGCPMPCMDWRDLNNDGDLDGAESAKATKLFEAALKRYEEGGLRISVRNAT